MTVSAELVCQTCENTITPGERRVPAGTGAKHELCQLKDDLRDEFRFHILNPPREGFSWALWRREGDREYPVLTNTGGLNTIHSTHVGVGSDALTPTEPFFPSIAYTHHWLMCLMRGVDHDEIDEELEQWYPNGKVPDHERWAIHIIVAHFHPPGRVNPEFESLREYVDGCTAMGVPEVTEP